MITGVLNRYVELLTLVAIYSLCLIPLFYLWKILEILIWYASFDEGYIKQRVFGDAGYLTILGFCLKSLITIGNVSFVVAGTVLARSLQIYRSNHTGVSNRGV